MCPFEAIEILIKQVQLRRQLERHLRCNFALLESFIKTLACTTGVIGALIGVFGTTREIHEGNLEPRSPTARRISHIST